jgi:hypothetical protein
MYARGFQNGGPIASGGSGGAVKLVAARVQGSGEISCIGNDVGRIRIETPALSPSLRTYPETIAVAPATPPQLWPPEAAPTVRIISVNNVSAPKDPTAPLLSGADVSIQNNEASVIVVETRNFPLEGIVQVRVAQKWGSSPDKGGFWIRAYPISGNQAVANWKATNTFVKGFTTLQARATAP